MAEQLRASTVAQNQALVGLCVTVQLLDLKPSRASTLLCFLLLRWNSVPLFLPLSFPPPPWAFAPVGPQADPLFWPLAYISLCKSDALVAC